MTTAIIAEVQEASHCHGSASCESPRRLLCLLSDLPASRVHLFPSPYLSRNVSFASE